MTTQVGTLIKQKEVNLDIYYNIYLLNLDPSVPQLKLHTDFR